MNTDNPPISPASRPANHFVFLACLAAVFVFTLTLFVPWNTSFSSGLLDDSWCMALHWAHQNGIDFGNQLVFTFGPWGFIYQGYVPATFHWTVACWSLIGAAYFAGVYQLGRKIGSGRWIILPWMVLAVALACSSAALSQDVRLYSMSWLLVLLHFYIPERRLAGTKILLILAMALASLVKFSTTFMAVSAILAISTDQIRRRRIPWHAMAFVAAYLAWWLAAGQKLSSLTPYLHHSWSIVDGYTQAMATAMPNDDLSLVLVLCGIALLIGQLTFVHFGQSGSKLAALAALLAAIFMAFKAGYVRHDLHEATADASLMLLSMFYAAALWKSSLNRGGRVLIVFTTLFFTGLTWNCYVDRLGRGVVNELANTFETVWPNLHTAVLWIAGGPELEDRYQQEIDSMRTLEIPKVHGTADIYPWGAALLMVNGAEYRPRPVIQSYQPYTADLAALNANFLDSSQAPDTILFGVATIDRRFPAQDDGASWPNLLTRYDPQSVGKSVLVLTRAASPRDYSIVRLKQVDVPMGKWTPVPESPDPIWVNIDLKLTLLGKLLEAVYRSPRAVIEVKYADGRMQPFRLIPRLGASGFLLSPVVTNSNAFTLLSSDKWKEQLRRSLAVAMTVGITTDITTNPCYEPTFSVTFSALRYPHRDLSQLPGINDALKSIAAQ